MIEVEAHVALRDFLRAHPNYHWPHYLTMARLVARALRLGRSAAIQAGTFSSCHPEASLGYLMPLLLWPQATIVVVDDALRSRLQTVEIPQLMAWMECNVEPDITPKPQKPVIEGDHWRNATFNGVLLVSHHDWLRDRLDHHHLPPGVPTVIDDLDRLTTTARRLLTLELRDRDWSDALEAAGTQSLAATEIRARRAELVHTLYHHPANPYDAYLLDIDEQTALREAVAIATASDRLPPIWHNLHARLRDANCFLWAQLDRDRGGLILHQSPASVAHALEAVWSQQPVVTIDGTHTAHDRYADYLRDDLGLADVTCVQFNPDRQTTGVQLYLPDRLPLPNTPEYRDKLFDELHHLIRTVPGGVAPRPTANPTAIPIAIIIGDDPLKQSIAALLAAEFGSRVKVERDDLATTDILICGWRFWCDHLSQLPPPSVLAISTLPLPSPEHPLVAGRVACSKQQRQDWFRRYLLPEAVRTLQRSIAPVRSTQGVVALFDTRAVYRSYGKEILRAISPYSELRYLDVNLWLVEDN